MKKYIITIITLFLIILISIGGYFIYANAKQNQGNSNDMLKDKAISEIEFLSNELINVMNGLNNLSYTKNRLINQDVNVSESSSENNIKTSENTVDRTIIEYESTLNGNNDDINWEEIKEKTENIYVSWTTVLIDLTSLNVNKDNLLKFNDLLDKLISAEDEKNKNLSLTYSSDLYNLLFLYVNDFSEDNQLKIVYNIKSNILYAYSLIESEKWDEAKSYIEKAKTEFNNIMNNQINNINNIDDINKAYILINELVDDVNKKSKKTFYINYQEIMQELLV